LGGRWRIRAGYELELEEASNVRGVLAPEDRAGFVRTAGLLAEVRYDGRDDAFLPRRGTLLNGRVFWSTPALAADLDYLELELTAVTYREVDADTVLAIGGSLRTRKPLDGASTLPVQQRYFLGGESSVRSFEEQELSPLDASGTATGGLTALEGHVELRRRILQQLHGALFYDIGLVDGKPLSLDAVPGHAVGLGLRYYLPIGPIRVDVAYGPGARFAAQSRWALHVGFGFSF
jgi:outer membrane translocation and assembly module TamA